MKAQLILLGLLVLNSTYAFANDCTYKLDSKSNRLIRLATGWPGLNIHADKAIQDTKKILESRGWFFSEESTNTLVIEEDKFLEVHKGWYGYLTGYPLDNTRLTFSLKLSIQDSSTKTITSSKAGKYNVYSQENIGGVRSSGDNTRLGVLSAAKKSLRSFSQCVQD